MANGTLANEVSYLEYQGKHKGIMGWLLSVDHKRIGLMYLMAILIFFFCSYDTWCAYEAGNADTG